MIRITRTNDEIVAISFNGDDLQSNGEDRWYLPKGLIGDEIVNHLPADIIFEICDLNKNQGIVRTTIPIYLRKISENIVLVNYEEARSRDKWQGPNGLTSYMETKKEVITRRAGELEDISLDLYKDDGDRIRLFFSTKIWANTINVAILLAEQMLAEIESGIEELITQKT